MADSRLMPTIDNIVALLQQRTPIDLEFAKDLHRAARANAQLIKNIVELLVPALDKQELFLLTQAAMLGHLHAEAPGADNPFLRATSTLSGTLYKAYADKIGYRPSLDITQQELMPPTMRCLNQIVFEFKCANQDDKTAQIKAASEIHFKFLDVQGNDWQALQALNEKRKEILDKLNDAMGKTMQEVSAATNGNIIFKRDQQRAAS